MSVVVEQLGDDLSSFCKITYRVSKDVADLIGRGNAEAFLNEGWKQSFADGSYHVKGGTIIFPIPLPRVGEESAWVEVVLKKSDKEGETLPYWTCGANRQEGVMREYDSLESFAFVRWELYDELAEMALDEPWSFSGEGNELLKFYLNGTFLRLLDEGKVSYASDSEGRMCVWCTGLVDAHYEDIYCFCTPNDHPNARQDWVVRSFCTVGSTHFGQRMRRAFGTEPPLRANYFGNMSEIVYDGNLDLVVDYGHVMQRVHRIAIPALRTLLSSSRVAMEVIDRAESLGAQAREAALKELNAIVEEDTLLRRSLHDAIALASERARARARYMYSSALPSWNPRGGGSVAFCLPLCLVVEERVDTVLIARLADGAKELFYEGKTLFDIQMAYKNARVVQRTDGMTGWVSSAFKATEDQDDSSSAFAPTSMAQTPALAKAPRLSSTPVSSGLPAFVRPRLTSEIEELPTLMVCDGDTIGLLRRQVGDIPRIQLPTCEGFEGVSQIQGRFSQQGECWLYTHEGSNWTQVIKTDGGQVVLEERGASAELAFGDKLSFTGSPSYTFEQ